jgi:DNA-binding response OmpR family regulator
MDILLVEAVPGTPQRLEKSLRQRGHAVTCCCEGKRAWAVCQACNFPLIILDWPLPGLDSLDLCRRIRALKEGERSVILLATAGLSEESLRPGLAAGADDFLHKPVEPHTLDIRLTIAEQRVEERSAAEHWLGVAFSQLERSRADMLAIMEHLRTGTTPVAPVQQQPASGWVPEWVNEKERLQAALVRARGNRTVAANLLGISRATLYRRLSELDIPTKKRR